MNKKILLKSILSTVALLVFAGLWILAMINIPFLTSPVMMIIYFVLMIISIAARYFVKYSEESVTLSFDDNLIGEDLTVKDALMIGTKAIAQVLSESNEDNVRLDSHITLESGEVFKITIDAYMHLVEE